MRGGNFLSIDSSVFVYYTSDDPELPKNLTLDAEGNERFKRYLPMDRSFVNTIENYPYPYVIGNLCWQFPCMTPSDWQAQHLQKPNNPKTVEDWKAALDCTVIKQGVMTMVFHPHGWIQSDQMVELIDYAVAKHGKKVKFLTFKEALDRLNKNLFRDVPIRDQLSQSSSRVSDLNGDGFLDVVPGPPFHSKERWHWVPSKSGGRWKTVAMKWPDANRVPKWDPAPPTHYFDSDGGVVDMNGISFMFFQKGSHTEIYKFNADVFGGQRLPFGLPPGVRLRGPSNDHKDTGYRFLDLNADGKLDIIFSNEKEYGIYLFTDMEKGWSKKVLAGKRGDNGERGALAPRELPMISRRGQNNGFWVHSGYLWWSNEDTALLKDHVDRRKIADLLK